MNASQATLPFGNKQSPSDEIKPGFRTKTAATRLTPSELAEIETAAESAGKPLSEWLRETALSAARQRPADPAELLLAEVWAVRYALLSLFHAGALATSEGKVLLPDSILKIRDQADTRKLQQARKLLAEFVASEGKGGGS
jgi:mobilization protein NikA